jgi:hypothetical protein
VHQRLVSTVQNMVARWYIFRPKNPNLGTFWRALLAMEDFIIVYGPLVYFSEIWYIFVHMAYFVVIC